MAQSGRPVPKPPKPVQRWFQERVSDFPWEQDGLDHIKGLMPDVEPYRAWPLFSFVAPSGRVHECDLFIATPGGLYLVELKGHPGQVVNNGGTWTFSGPDRRRTLRNPLALTDWKSKELKDRLIWAAKDLGYFSVRVPRIEPAVFLSAPNLVSRLDTVQQTRVYGRDDLNTGLGRIWHDLLGRPPERESRRVGADFSKRLPRMLERIGISHSTAHLRFGDEWRMEPRVLEAGPAWEDRLAERDDMVHEEGRVRIYLVSQQATDEARRTVDRAARREYQVLQGINHPGIAQAVQIREHRGGSAILFRHDHRDLRLDSYLDVHGESLTPETRLALVRQLAEAVRYAHNRSLYHRALAARSVYVSAKDDGSQPVLRIIDWQTAARDFDTARPMTIGQSSLDGDLVDDAAQVYLAPEFDQPYPDPVDMDVFGIGAISYLILTGRPPAADRADLIDAVTKAGGLHPYAVVDGMGDRIDELIFQATQGFPPNRLESADRFLEELDAAEQDAAVPEDEPTGGWEGVDPLTATPGQVVDGDADGVWRVERLLGTGATSRALLVRRDAEDEEGAEPGPERVLKVALDESKAPRLAAEAAALAKVGGGAIVRLLGGPRTLGGRTVLDLEFAGDRTLAAVLHDDGKLTYHQLERFGRDLFRALDQLVAKGVRHRDLKPENFGVLRRADRTWELKLLDFSLTDVSDRDPSAGTRGYLDPFLGTPSRPDFDDHAERYAAAVTLHEMASGERPRWGDEGTDPRTVDDPHPYLSAELFERALRDGLTGFFRRALHRDVSERFDTFAQMEAAWQDIFRRADATAPATTQATLAGGDVDPGLGPEELKAARDTAAEAATLGTPLIAAGLSPRAEAVALGFNATTVGQLLDVPAYQISKACGAGAVAKKELTRRHRQWAAKLRPHGGPGPHAEDEPVAGPADPAPPGNARAGTRVDDLAALLVQADERRASRKGRTLRLLLGLPDDDAAPLDDPWPTQSAVAKAIGTTQATVSRHHKEAIERWAAADWLAPVRDELVALVRGLGGVTTAAELADLLRVRHGAAEGPAEVTAARSRAVVRAAVEAETFTGTDAEGGAEPRLDRVRRGRHVLVALESLPGTDDPTPAELAGYAAALGSRADDLAAQEPLPGGAEVIRVLRGIVPPAGMTPLSDTRLVHLASSVAENALASPTLQVYPRGLTLAKALRLSQAGAGVRFPRGVTLADLLTKVSARFPGLDAYTPAPSYVDVEEALRDAGFPLHYDQTTERFYPPAPAGPRTPSSSTTATRLGAGLGVPGEGPEDLADARLATAARQGGFLALTIHLKRLAGVAEAISAKYPVTPVNFADVFLAEFRSLAAEQGTDWGQVLRADERLTRTGEMPSGLRSFVVRVLDRTGQRLLDHAAPPRTVLFVHNLGLLARYFDVGGHDLLAGLQNAARRASDVPHGLWLLCPSEAPRATPNLDGRTVEAIGATEWTLLDKAFVARLRGGKAA
ncbi:BREX system serine/threonine kinase PglW [Actinomadura terrae]|uniref:BREX system serine/threonine kinase PglW n=1 Tax=Actinomadura terrae TaxID=604353 RepID=UPI00234306EB|nr:BREX system serine/threonine kinase PglW [Actinomadura terrae]